MDPLTREKNYKSPPPRPRGAPPAIMAYRYPPPPAAVPAETSASIARSAYLYVADAVADDLRAGGGGGSGPPGNGVRRTRRTESNHLLEAHFQVALEEFERALRLNPRCAESLTWCARGCFLQCQCATESRDVAHLFRRATGLFETALRGTGLPRYEVLRSWGNALLQYSRSQNAADRRAALLSDAISKYEAGYDARPDTEAWSNPIVADWDRALVEQKEIHQSWR